MRVCNFPDCERKHKGHGYCGAHLKQIRREGLGILLERVALPIGFKWIPTWENRYAADRKGQIWSRRFDRVLTPTGKPNDYQFVSLGNLKKRYTIHRLVASTFKPNPEDKPCVNHIDGNKTNNKVSNLEWCTYSENERHSYAVLGKGVKI